jgi:sialic acid synthase SpsE
VSGAFRVGEREIGGDAPVFVVAEIGANHDGDISVAHEMVEMAADAGADAVKFQTYTATELVADYDRVTSWGREGQRHEEKIGALYDRLALPRDEHAGLFEHARKLGMVAFSTPFSVDGARFLASLGAPLVKLASSELCDVDLLDELGRSGAAVVVSTGKATLAETDTAVRRLQGHRPPGVAVLHCVASYPAEMEELNLRVIPVLAQLYPDCAIGFSDHSLGITGCLGAVALGAKVVEKHVTLDPERDGPDHWFSSGPAELKALVDGVRGLEAALGDGVKRVQPSEEHERITSNRSLVTAAPVAAGQALTREVVTIRRPGTGIHPFDLDKALGLRPTADLAAGHVLTWDDFR